MGGDWIGVGAWWRGGVRQASWSGRLLIVLGSEDRFRDGEGSRQGVAGSGPERQSSSRFEVRGRLRLRFRGDELALLRRYADMPIRRHDPLPALDEAVF
jgi:hypothetical protein